MFKLFDKFRTPAPKTKRMQAWDKLNETTIQHIDLEFSKGVYQIPDKPTGFVLIDKDAVKIFNALVDRNKKQIEQRIGQTVESLFIGKSESTRTSEPLKFQHPNCRCIPKPKTPLVLVPLSDYEIMKIIRLGWALGEGTTQLPIEESGYTENEENETHYNNAKILHKFYGIPKDEIFQLTGCVLNDDI